MKQRHFSNIQERQKASPENTMGTTLLNSILKAFTKSLLEQLGQKTPERKNREPARRGRQLRQFST